MQSDRNLVRTFEQEDSCKDAAGPAITRSNPEGKSGTGLGRSWVAGLEDAFSKGIEDVDAMWVDSSFYLSPLLGTN